MTADSMIEHEGTSFQWSECLSDFAGNSRQPGCWSDIWIAQDGSRLVSFGGCWEWFFLTQEEIDKLQVPGYLTGNLATEAERLLRSEQIRKLYAFLRPLLQPISEAQPA